MKQCNFQNNYGVMHRGRSVVVHLYLFFFFGPLTFFLGANLYQNCDFAGFLKL